MRAVPVLTSIFATTGLCQYAVIVNVGNPISYIFCNRGSPGFDCEGQNKGWHTFCCSDIKYGSFSNRKTIGRTIRADEAGQQGGDPARCASGLNYEDQGQLYCAK
ncbi:hypothetical protein Tdes44962_MAKER09440 [Teratosphaeria destructans]|uniref:Uncharacterized protein n=1 Tax=Teratosphaeria destructans TaxID=418781 RepID=A0A9W7STG5_9PEZI|nr:hypothetical protein Tdes44962_MAKER09440 [Teratosphaeria destructans]